MPPAQAEEIIALGLVFVVHVIGGLMLVWALLDAEQRAGWRRRWRWGRGGDDGPPRPPAPQPSGGRARVEPPPLPLPAATPSAVRLREPARVADGYPRPARRPEHEPQPQRAPDPAREQPRSR